MQARFPLHSAVCEERILKKVPLQSASLALYIVGLRILSGQSNYLRSILATASQKIKSKETPCPRQSRLISVRCCPVEIIHPVAAVSKVDTDQAQPCLSILSIGLPIVQRHHQVSRAEFIRIPSYKSKGHSKNNVIRSFCGMLYATVCHDAGGLPIDRLEWPN